jgi:hypothetical protein
MMPGPGYPTKHAPMQCAHCRQPFPISNGRVEAWRSSRGAYFCNEFCADGDELSAWTPPQAVVRSPLVCIAGT